MATHEEDQSAPYVQSKHRESDCADNAPNDKGVPFPLPDVAQKAHRVAAEMFDLGPAQGKLRGVKDMYARLDKRDKEEQVQRRHRLCADLGCQLIQSEHPGDDDY